VIAAIPYNTLVVVAGVAAVGFAAGVVGSLGVLRRRALVGDAAAHATLVGVAAAFLATGRRDLPVLLLGAFVAAVAALGVLVLLRRFTRTRDDAATAIVLGVSFGAGIALISGITARGIPGGAGLEHFLLGHTAALTAADAWLLAGVSCAAVAAVVVGLKEATLVAFDAAYASATGWPVAVIDYVLVALVAVMVVAGLPAAGAVLVTALVVIPPVAARQWTDRVATMLVLAGLIGLGSAVVGVLVSGVVPRLATGPLVVLVAAAVFAVSFLFAPDRGWLARVVRLRGVERDWAEGRLLAAIWRLTAGGDALFTPAAVAARMSGGAGGLDPASTRAWTALAARGAVEPCGADGGRWRLSAAGRELAAERDRRLRLWNAVMEVSADDARSFLTIDLPAPEAVLEGSRLDAARAAAGDTPGHARP
jgi:manganese/zinc/iron transport system permease protein